MFQFLLRYLTMLWLCALQCRCVIAACINVVNITSSGHYNIIYPVIVVIVQNWFLIIEPLLSCFVLPSSVTSLDFPLVPSLVQSSLVVEVPPYHSKTVTSAVQVQFYVCNGKRKRSQSQRFTYLSGTVGAQQHRVIPPLNQHTESCLSAPVPGSCLEC